MLYKTKRLLISICLIIICFLLQTTVFQSLNFGGIVPNLMMILTAGGICGAESSAEMGAILAEHQWTWQNSLCTIVFFLFHWPCTTTLMTIKKETGSLRWTLLAILLPTAFGAALCALLNWLL